MHWSRCDSSRNNLTPCEEFSQETREEAQSMAPTQRNPGPSWLDSPVVFSNSESLMNDNRPPIKSATEARQGQMTGVVRWVLGVSLALVIIAMLVAYFV